MQLDEGIVRKFMEKMSVAVSHNINIMNEKGIIIASSKDPSRIGTFHEIAYNMIQNEIRQSSTEFQSDYAGTMIGVNLLIEHDGKSIGVCGVTGKPNEVMDIAKLLKVTLETMLDYEAHHERLQERKNLKFRFTNTLLYSEDEEQVKALPEMARGLGYDPMILRIPVLIHFHNHNNIDEAMLQEKIKASMYVNRQDILVITRNRCLMLFKSFDGMKAETVFSCYKSVIEEFIGNLQQFIMFNKYDCSFYIGCFQDRLINYAYEFKHLKWLRTYHKAAAGEITYFYDHVGEYMVYNLPFAEIYKIFDVFTHYMAEDMVSNIRETIPQMEVNNYNLNAASQQLFIHKNTLVFRINKIRRFFGINPVQNPEDRYFASYMAFYLRQQGNEADF